MPRAKKVQKLKDGPSRAIKASSSMITGEQSQNLIRTMLTMSFGCVAFLRGLFPDENFIDQKFIPGKFEPGYDPNAEKNRTQCIRVKTLVRGMNHQADLFLRWIDEGVLDAVKKGYLKSLSFVIFLDSNNPSNLHEAYTFFFDYHSDTIKLSLNDEEFKVSLLNSRKMLQQLIRRFIIVTQSLEPLPDQKYMSIRLLFNERCPSDYQPPLFKDASQDPVSTVKVTPQAGSSLAIGAITTNHHEIQLNVISCSLFSDEEGTVDYNVIEVDPFEASRASTEAVSIAQQPKAKLIASKYEMSQTTAMLKSFLQDSQNSVVETQAIPNM